MKNISTIKSSKTDSPKTPGGISISLLTPCRRVGLSRNLKKGGALPFQSPLSSKIEEKQEKVETRKRKEPLEETSQTPENIDDNNYRPEGLDVQTPIRKIEQPSRKRSKTLLSSLTKGCDESGPPENVIQTLDNTTTELYEIIPNDSNKDLPNKDADIENTTNTSYMQVVTPLRLKCKSRIKKYPTNSISKEMNVEFSKENVSFNSMSEHEPKTIKVKDTNKKSPNNLTKECVVVIQKKIFKKELRDKEKSPKNKEKVKAISSQTNESISQPAFDSDSDDIPLICLNKDTKNDEPDINPYENDEDFVSSKTKISKPIKTKSKIKPKSPPVKTKINSRIVKVEIHKGPDSQCSDDDDDFKKKRTILIRKTYDKVTKPQKMKSTGSITQKDIDDITKRIEFKKNLLLARAGSDDTKELMDLIKKWHKGCQESLIQLMDLMKSKCSEKQNMGYSEILENLKIPSSLVGYDSDNDCFLTPDDESIIASVI